MRWKKIFESTESYKWNYWENGKHYIWLRFHLVLETVEEVNNLKTFLKKIFLKKNKENIDIVSYFLYHKFNNSLSCSTFPNGMRHPEVTPIHKKGDKYKYFP